MVKDNGPKRKSVIRPDFDREAIWRRAEQADQDRQPTQEELAADLGSDPDMVACVRAFPNSVEEIVAGICEGDGRFLDQGRKLLKQHLRNNAKADPNSPKKLRGRGARRSDTAPTSARSGGSTVASQRSLASIVPQSPPATASTPLFDTANYGDADEYGG